MYIYEICMYVICKYVPFSSHALRIISICTHITHKYIHVYARAYTYVYMYTYTFSIYVYIYVPKLYVPKFMLMISYVYSRAFDETLVDFLINN